MPSGRTMPTLSPSPTITSCAGSAAAGSRVRGEREGRVRGGQASQLCCSTGARSVCWAASCARPRTRPAQRPRARRCTHLDARCGNLAGCRRGDDAGLWQTELEGLQRLNVGAQAQVGGADGDVLLLGAAPGPGGRDRQDQEGPGVLQRRGALTLGISGCPASSIRRQDPPRGGLSSAAPAAAATHPAAASRTHVPGLTGRRCGGAVPAASSWP